MKKALNKLCSLTLILALLISCCSIISVYAVDTRALPRQVTVGYWHNFNNKISTTTKLRDVNGNWDVLNVAFMLSHITTAQAQFEASEDIYSGDLEARNAELKSDIQYLKSRGKFVVISVGGETGVVQVNSTVQRDTFLESSWAIIKEFGFDGIDIDLESGSVSMAANDSITNPSTPFQQNMIYILHQLASRFKAEYGRDMILSMAPEHQYAQGGTIAMNVPYGGYLPMLNCTRDILTYIHPQYYNNSTSGYSFWDGKSYNYGTVDAVLALSEMLLMGFETSNKQQFAPLRPDQVAIGLPASTGAAGSGQVPLAQLAAGLKYIVTGNLAGSGYTGAYRLYKSAGYPTFRGIMAWSTNWDEKVNSHGFVNAIHQAIVDIGGNVPAFSISSLTSDKSGTSYTGTPIIWTASTAGGSGTPQYMFEVYKGTTKITGTSYGSSSTYTYTPTTAGSYTVVVSAKDTANATASKESEAINIALPPIYVSVSANKSGQIVAGTPITWTAGSSGGNGAVQYQFELYKNTIKIQTVPFGSSSTFTYTPVNPATYSVVVTAKDTAGSTGSITSNGIQVLSQPLSVNIVPDKTGTQAPRTVITFAAQATGGKGGNKYTFIISRAGKLCYASSDTNTAHISYAPCQKGTYNVYISCTDSDNIQVSGNYTFTVS